EPCISSIWQPCLVLVVPGTFPGGYDHRILSTTPSPECVCYLLAHQWWLICYHTHLNRSATDENARSTQPTQHADTTQNQTAPLSFIGTQRSKCQVFHPLATP